MLLNEAREKHSQSQEPYYIPLLLDKGDSHWLEAVIYINPTEKVIHYSLKDSARLSEAQIKELEQTMQKAISFHTTFTVNQQVKTYEAYPGKDWKIKGTINSNTHVDGTYIEGYRALHNVLNEPTLSDHLKLNGSAKTYASCPDDSSSLVKEVYKQELEQLNLDSSLQQQSPETFLQNLASSLARKEKISTKPFVQKKVDEYNAFHKVVRFPGAGLESLHAQDYEDYLHKLSLRLRIIKNLEKLIITSCTLTALDGLNAFIPKTAHLRFDELRLDLDNSLGEDKKKFLLKFKTLLLNLSEKT